MARDMMLTKEKLRKRIERLKSYRYHHEQPLLEWHWTLDAAGNNGAYPPTSLSGESIRVGDCWRGRDVYAWLTREIQVPPEEQGSRALLRLDFGRTGGGNNSGFESLLFLNGRPFQGVDQNHTEVFLPDELAGSTVRIDVRVWSGLSGGGAPCELEHTLGLAQMAYLDDNTDDLYFTALSMLQTVDWIADADIAHIELLNTLDDAFRRIDWSSPGSIGFYESVSVARSVVWSYLNSVPAKHGVSVVCVGHTHIDVAWLWRLRHTREKAARSFSTVLRLMELYPEYYFLQTQPQLYDYMKQDYPDLYAQIRERIREGRWEAEGAMWLEADCNIPSGESLVRQILFGTRFLRQEFGVECTYLWLPDVFGYSWALPQILRGCGIKTFMTTKISWNQYNRMPHDTFRWRGIDGSEVLAHFVTTPEPDKHDGWFYTYNGQLTADTVGGAWQAYQDKRVNHNLLVSYGFGDGGGGVTRDMLEMRRRLDVMPGLPSVRTGRADAYFRGLHETIDNSSEYVHTWDGELYLEYHRGTYTSQAYNKRMNRKLELAYRNAEWLNVLTNVLGAQSWSKMRERQGRLNEGWKIILRNQFHDIIPGSSIHEVYEDSRIEYGEALALVDVTLQESESAIQSEANPNVWTVYNSANWARDSIVRLPDEEATGEISWRDSNGELLNAQRIGSEWWIAVPSVPSCGWTTLRSAATQPASSDIALFSVSENRISSPYYELEWNDEGKWTRLYDRRARREVLAQNQRANMFQVFEDIPLAHDAWDIDLFYTEKGEEIGQLEYARILSTGNVACVVEFCWNYGASSIVQQVVLYVKNPRIDCVTRVQWNERQRLLKVAFPVRIRAVEATYDIQFGNVKRPTHWNTSWDWARFETVGHQWADLSESGYGVALANDCKYGYDVKDNVLRLSLLKSAVHPDPEADRGEHTFTYSLLPHLGDWREGEVVHHAWDLNSPLVMRRGRLPSDSGSLFRVSDANVMLDAIKISEDDNRVLLRLHEFSGGSRAIQVDSDFPIASWQECDLLERPIGTVLSGDFQMEIGAYQIRSFLIDFESAVP